jgi:hypothetical protein
MQAVAEGLECRVMQPLPQRKRVVSPVVKEAEEMQSLIETKREALGRPTLEEAVAEGILTALEGRGVQV